MELTETCNEDEEIRLSKEIADSVGFIAQAGAGTSRAKRLEFRDPTNGKSYCQGDLLSVPLVYPAGTKGVGYNSGVNAALDDTGKPIFVGQTNSSDLNRSPMANTPGGTNTVLAQDGYEQFLDIRWGIQQGSVTGLDGMDNSEVIIGQGGFQVYIIGKKHLC